MSQHSAAKFRFETSWKSISNPNIKRISAVLRVSQSRTQPSQLPSQGCGWNHHVAEDNNEKNTLFKDQFVVLNAYNLNLYHRTQ